VSGVSGAASFLAAHALDVAIAAAISTPQIPVIVFALIASFPPSLSR